MTLTARVLASVRRKASTNTELAHRLKESPGSISSITHRLWKRGLLRRERLTGYHRPQDSVVHTLRYSSTQAGARRVV